MMEIDELAIQKILADEWPIITEIVEKVEHEILKHSLELQGLTK
jgi:hypothetical protein